MVISERSGVRGRRRQSSWSRSAASRKSALGLLAAAVMGMALPLALLDQRHSAAESEPALTAEDLRTPPTEPEQAVATFEVLDGFRMELLAAEPLVADPVAMVYDENGRAYVLEMRDYPHAVKEDDEPFTEQTDQPPLGRVRLLEDTDGDGVFDESHIFADELSWPAGLACWKGGIYVGATPDIWYLKDTDGDRRADVRERVFTGFRKFNVQAVMNNLQWGLDHRIYGAASGNGGTVSSVEEESREGQSVENLRISRRDFRFEPGTREIEITSGGARFGHSIDNWGNRFLCNIRNPCQHVVLPDRYLSRNRYLAVPSAIADAAPSGDQLPVYRISPPEKWRVLSARIRLAERAEHLPRDTFVSNLVTSSSGVTVYRGGAYPEPYRGNAFTGEVASNLLYRQTLTPVGPTFRAERPDARTEFVRSRDNWFRPVNFANAPDGTLHILDMYREVIEHPWSVPEELWKLIDFRSGSDRGRIYRLAPPGFTPPAPPRLGEATTEELVSHLASPHGWYRDTAHRLLYERQDRSAAAALRQLLRESDSELARLHALWSLEGLDSLEPADVLLGLSDASSGVREHAVRLAEPRLNPKPANAETKSTAAELLDRILQLAEDPDPRVRFQVAFTLGETDDPRRLAALAKIAVRDVADPWTRPAVLSSIAGEADALLGLLLEQKAVTAAEAGWEWLYELAMLVGAENDREAATQVLAWATEADQGPQLAIVSGLGDGLRRAKQSLGALAEESAEAREVVARIIERSIETAGDEQQPVEVRVQAIELLSHGQLEQLGPTLLSLLDARQPHEVQLAAVQTLGHFSDAELPSLLLGSWRSFTPPVRDRLVETFMSRPNWTPDLLTALESGRVSPGQLTPMQRYRLLERSPEEIKQRSAKIFADSVLGGRREVIEKYRPSLSLAADRERGRAVFQRVCAACHRFEDSGFDIGPPLALVAHRAPENVLVNLLDPNREVAPDYLEYLVLTDDGRTITGIVVAETAASITLRQPQGVEETVLRENIERMVSSGKSIMPEGLEEMIDPQQMADLLAYLLESQSGSR
ncbi:PVC-type heme-binding CxxCH protein [Candidatus Laterigemmans baculatus]|uniref:PVC-type heme-binding CxxCH protein n=1 Tax=Candidatus Laterigemmans baculatus TaxID=2770505 RepID=UPI0013DCA745|nr:PVC-type heme-binding CxxCH protein [Candidatus Laterigemmans baculatus]